MACWALATRHGHFIVSHRGDWQGFTSHLFHLPEARLTISVLMNRAQAQPEVIVDRIAALYVKALRPQQQQHSPTPAAPATSAAARH
jgi:hypothetical protein